LKRYFDNTKADKSHDMSAFFMIRISFLNKRSLSNFASD